MPIRSQIEDRIKKIISYIDINNIMKPLLGKLNLFSLEELLMLQKFLEFGDYNTMYQLLDEKIKEYIHTKKEIKQIKIKNKMQKIKEEELEEEIKENKDLEKLLDI